MLQIKQISLPRLELCAAVVLAELLATVLELLPHTPSEITCWSDSTVTSWIAGQPSRWSTFVANRVTKIQSLTNNIKWHHVPSQLNPADLLSRGTTADNIISNKLWLNGPPFIKLPPSNWPPQLQTVNTILEVRPLKVVHTTTITHDLIINHTFINNYKTMVRIFAYIKRFITLCHKVPITHGAITAAEMNQATNTICRLIQYCYFKEDLSSLCRNGCMKRQSKLIPLSPFLHDNLIRVGGRLSNSSLKASNFTALFTSILQDVNSIFPQPTPSCRYSNFAKPY
ncbi:uncharacterized protein LOC142235611 [Haematobia irritans]|uniref:uncharacterized protein LOC142235611 n=1 Tax=Haematobia irritans TaxID=7368 RepID=UPI003F505285